MIRFALIGFIAVLVVLGGFKYFESEVRDFIKSNVTPAMLQKHSSVYGPRTDPPMLYRTSFNQDGPIKYLLYSPECDASHTVYPLRL